MPKAKKKGTLLLTGFAVVQLLLVLLPRVSQGSVYALLRFVPSVLWCEGGVLWVALGVWMFLTVGDKTKFSIMYLMYCLLVFYNTFMMYNANLMFLTTSWNQWLMVLALPLMLLYNGKKGPGAKWLFYVFYPLHIWLLFLLANTLFA